jgi:hypothetical protein
MNFIKNIIIGAPAFLSLATANAEHLNWTLTPLTPTHIKILETETEIIRYKMTNHTILPQLLDVKHIDGITVVDPLDERGHEDECGNYFVLRSQQSCILTLKVHGPHIRGEIRGGPEVCYWINPLWCIAPEEEHQLWIEIDHPIPIEEFTVSPSARHHGSINPNTDQVVKAGSTLSFTAKADAGYGVREWYLDHKQVQKGGTTYQLNHVKANHQIEVTFGQVTLTPSVSSLALSVACASPNEECAVVNPALTGKSRQITLTNTGSIDATNVAVNISGLPKGTKISNTTCKGTLTASDSCTVTITPGPVASADADKKPCTSGTVPKAGEILITADGGLISKINTSVLGYGCIYQGGHIYSVDDHDSLINHSIGGKVAALADQARAYPKGIIWSTNGHGRNSGDVDYFNIPGIYENTTKPCHGAADGACNSKRILEHYSAAPVSYYAAGLCTTPIDGYSDWYLPAICELGYDNQCAKSGSPCGTSDAPNVQNMQSNLVDRGNIGALSGYYWSSTGHASVPLFYAWFHNFSAKGESFQLYDFKLNQFGVRCARNLTS